MRTSPLLAGERGWQVTGLARAEDEEFVRSLGVDFIAEASPDGTPSPTAESSRSRAWPWSATAACFVGVQPSAQPAAERGIRIDVVVTAPTEPAWASCWSGRRLGELPARVHAVVPLEDVADVHRAVAKGGVRGRYVLTP